MSAGLVIAGGGLAAQRCCAALRAAGDDRPVTIVGDERHRPYDRPPLSKSALAADGADVAFQPASWYREHGITVRLGSAATGLDARRRELRLAGGGRLRYDDLLIATGAHARPLPALAGFANVQSLRTRDDAARLRAALRERGPLVIVGAGLIGLEAAAAARAAGVPVTIVEAAAQPLAGVLGPRAARWIAGRHAAAGADLRLGVTVVRAEGGARAERLTLRDGTSVPCAHVLVGVGVVPATGWLAGSGLGPGAIATDTQGRTAVPHVYAAGDAACVRESATGRAEPGGHWEAAARGGVAVAAALTGRPARPVAPPSFWTDQHGVRLVCVGDPRDARESSGALPHTAPFVLDYRRDGRLAAVLLADPAPAALRAARVRLTVPDTERTAA